MPNRFPLLCLFAAAVVLTVAGASPTTAGPRDPVQRARALLSQNSTGYGLSAGLTDLRLSEWRESLTADHVRFQQTMNGVPVFGGGVTVSLPRDGTEPAVTSRYISRPAAPASVSNTPAAAFARAQSAIGLGEEAAPAALVYFPAGKALRPAWQLTVHTIHPFGAWLVVVDAASGEVLYRHNLLAFDSGRVFDPNPAQTNGGTPPAPNCDNDANQALMASQYFTRSLQGITAGQGKLKGEWVDMTAPGITGAYRPAGLADEPTHNYLYGCNDFRFEEVMAYYHLDRTQRKIQALGFTGPSGIVQRPVPVHAHFMPDCNSFFDPTNRGLHFGDFNSDSFFPGGCGGSPPLDDSGEDADWIIHEYGHAILDDQVPGWAFGPFPLAEQAAAMGEGFGDYLAANMNADPCWGEYVSLGLLACGGARGARWLQNSRTYPAGFHGCPNVDLNGDTVAESEEPHCGGEVWSGALWDLTEAIGGGSATQQARDVALTLVLESQFYLDQQATFDEAAGAICLADSILYGSSHSAQIAAAFSGRGISSGSCNAAADSPSIFYRVLHTSSGDLEITLKVGTDVNAPVCSFPIATPNIQDGSDNKYVKYTLLTPPTCSAYLPPTAGQPWWLEARDGYAVDQGSIEDFEVLLAGGTRCISADTPVPIPDGYASGDPPEFGAPAYARVDCSVKITAPNSTPTPTPSPTPMPGPHSFGNVDCTGGINSVDALKVLRANASLAYAQTEPCEDIGVQTLPNGKLQGDVNCSNGVNSIDALLLLRYAAALPVSQNEPCPDIGS